MKTSVKILITILILIIIVLAGTVFLLLTPKSTQRITLKNPVSDLSDEEAANYFSTDYIKFLLYSIEADQLHNPPLSSNTPKIQIEVEDKIYNAEIKDNAIKIEEGELAKKDMVIKTTKSEIIKILRNESYVKDSFASGLSSIEITADKSSLALKGYLGIYEKFT